MRIICPIKRVPDTAAEKKLDPADRTVDREQSDPVLNANDEWSIEEAMRISERDGAEVIALCMGPDEAQSTIRKALSYGLDGAIQISDPALHGSDAVATARVLAAALRQEQFDLIIMGNQSSDARTMLVPALLAEFLDLPALTYARKLEIDGSTLTVQRESPSGHVVVQAQMPAVVSVVEAINEPRYPSFKGIMAAKSKPLDVRDLAAIGVDAADVGLEGSWTQVVDVVARPPKEPGKRVEDDGSGSVGAKALAEFLAERKFI
ncbi:MAG TPA: electron transfer flavoprotein subunit beta/FixA family protein [Egibacteraceae bacterium]|nr:electron transfer flavoprotein subunit beta/FixA family protein [Egibacteraceae bacterium]